MQSGSSFSFAPVQAPTPPQPDRNGDDKIAVPSPPQVLVPVRPIPAVPVMSSPTPVAVLVPPLVFSVTGDQQPPHQQGQAQAVPHYQGAQPETLPPASAAVPVSSLVLLPSAVEVDCKEGDRQAPNQQDQVAPRYQGRWEGAQLEFVVHNNVQADDKMSLAHLLSNPNKVSQLLLLQKHSDSTPIRRLIAHEIQRQILQFKQQGLQAIEAKGDLDNLLQRLSAANQALKKAMQDVKAAIDPHGKKSLSSLGALLTDTFKHKPEHFQALLAAKRVRDSVLAEIEKISATKKVYESYVQKNQISYMEGELFQGRLDALAEITQQEVVVWQVQPGSQSLTAVHHYSARAAQQVVHLIYSSQQNSWNVLRAVNRQLSPNSTVLPAVPQLAKVGFADLGAAEWVRNYFWEAVNAIGDFNKTQKDAEIALEWLQLLLNHKAHFSLRQEWFAKKLTSLLERSRVHGEWQLLASSTDFFKRQEDINYHKHIVRVMTTLMDADREKMAEIFSKRRAVLQRAIDAVDQEFTRSVQYQELQGKVRLQQQANAQSEQCIAKAKAELAKLALANDEVNKSVADAKGEKDLKKIEEKRSDFASRESMFQMVIDGQQSVIEERQSRIDAEKTVLFRQFVDASRNGDVHKYPQNKQALERLNQEEKEFNTRFDTEQKQLENTYAQYQKMDQHCKFVQLPLRPEAKQVYSLTLDGVLHPVEIAKCEWRLTHRELAGSYANLADMPAGRYPVEEWKNYGNRTKLRKKRAGLKLSNVDAQSLRKLYVTLLDETIDDLVEDFKDKLILELSDYPHKKLSAHLAGSKQTREAYIDCNAAVFHNYLEQLKNQLLKKGAFFEFEQQGNSQRHNLWELSEKFMTKADSLKREDDALGIWYHAQQVTHQESISRLQGEDSSKQWLDRCEKLCVPIHLQRTDAERIQKEYPLVSNLEKVGVADLSQAELCDPDTGNTLMHFAVLMHAKMKSKAAEQRMIVSDAIALLLQHDADMAVLNQAQEKPDKFAGAEHSPGLTAQSLHLEAALNAIAPVSELAYKYKHCLQTALQELKEEMPQDSKRLSILLLRSRSPEKVSHDLKVIQEGVAVLRTASKNVDDTLLKQHMSRTALSAVSFFRDPDRLLLKANAGMIVSPQSPAAYALGVAYRRIGVNDVKAEVLYDEGKKSDQKVEMTQENLMARLAKEIENHQRTERAHQAEMVARQKAEELLRKETAARQQAEELLRKEATAHQQAEKLCRAQAAALQDAMKQQKVLEEALRAQSSNNNGTRPKL